MTAVLTLGPAVVVRRRRPVVVCVVALVVVLVTMLVTLAAGELGISLAELPSVVAGNGTRVQEWVLWTNRLPRPAGRCGGRGGVRGVRARCSSR